MWRFYEKLRKANTAYFLNTIGQIKGMLTCSEFLNTEVYSTPMQKDLNEVIRVNRTISLGTRSI